MIIIVATSSPRKIESVRKIASQIIGEEPKVEGQSADSSKVNTPWDEQTLSEARQRAEGIKNVHGDLWVGLKSGLVHRYGGVYEEAWVCVLDKNNKEFLGYSSGLKVPNKLLEKMQQSNIEHSDALDLLAAEYGLDAKETWGTYSDGKLLREIGLEEALRNALLQAFPSGKSLY
jgi:non-canonical (house-cleaning) NTP pyrophosphatase